VWFGADSPETPERTATRASARSAVERIFARLSPKKREVLALYELEGLSGPEIALRLGCPLPTVWTRLHHARRDFHKLCGKLGYTDIEELL